MIRKILVGLLALGTFAFMGFQVYTMYHMVFSAKDVIAEEEDGIVIRHGDTDGKQIAFTCNVDWGEEILPDMLAVFEENDLKITFFVSGKWAEKNPRLLRKLFIMGHEIQNHGYAHRMCSQISEDETRQEIKKTEDAIRLLTGVGTHIFAPPSGDYDEKTIEICKEMGYVLSLWSVDTIDWRADSNAQVIRDRVLNKNLNGTILLMHPKEETVKALPGIIEEINERGLTIVPLSRLLE